jgi:asparagine synthase (glutamine-hydrolysing)
MIYHLDEPQADAAPLNVYNICLAAREKGYKVLIGGTAGDDLFSGYRRHQAISYERYYNFIPKFISTTLKKISTFLSPKVPLFRRIRKLLIDINKSKLERMAGYFRWIPIKLNLSLFSAKNRLLLKNNNPNNYLYELLKNIPNENSDLNKMLYWELKTFLVDHNLNYSDKLSMAAGVEARVPFLDKELLEFSTKIPAKYKLKGMTTKYILKKVAERYLSKEVIYRTKAGFGAPVRKWITEDMDLMISNKLSKSNIEAQGIFNFESVNDLIQMNKKGEIDASYTIWGLLAIESWYSQFVNVK